MTHRDWLDADRFTCENGESKTAPGPVVGATGRIRGLPPIAPEVYRMLPHAHPLRIEARQ